MLREGIKHIALVLLGEDGLFQQEAARRRVLLHPGIVAGDDAVGALRQRPLQQAAKLQLAVAENAGIGREPFQIAAGKGIHHAAAEGFLLLPEGVGDAQLGADRRRVLRVLFAAAAVPPVVQPEGHAGDLIALLQRQQSRRRAVHSAAHGNKCLGHNDLLLS